MKVLVLCIAAVALTTPSWAMTEPAADSATTPRADQDGANGTKIICKREKIIGSRLGSKKICATAAEWEQMRADQRQTTERVQANRPRAGN